MSDKALVSLVAAILLNGRKYNNIEIGGVVADAFQITLLAEHEIAEFLRATDAAMAEATRSMGRPQSGV